MSKQEANTAEIIQKKLTEVIEFAKENEFHIAPVIKQLGDGSLIPQLIIKEWTDKEKLAAKSKKEVESKKSK